MTRDVKLISIYFTREPTAATQLHHALRDLVGYAGEVCGYRAGGDGKFDPEGAGWGYEVQIYAPSNVDKWAETLAAKLPAALRENGVRKAPRVEVVVYDSDNRKIERRRISVDLGGATA